MAGIPDEAFSRLQATANPSPSGEGGPLSLFVPLTLLIIFVLFYFTFRSVVETLMVMLGVPLSLKGRSFLTPEPSRTHSVGPRRGGGGLNNASSRRPFPFAL